MVVADLHVHTTNSDGTLALGDLPAAARAADLEAVAVTDHDRLHPDLEAPVTTRDGLTVVHGIELRVDAGDQHVDLLGYGVRRTDALVAEVERLQADRIERARRIVDCLEERLGVRLDVDFEPGVGRPHIAEAVAASPADHTVKSAFLELVGDGRPCYVARAVPTFDRGRELLADACGLVGLAHPFRYDDPEAALALTADLDAVERWYPYRSEFDPAPVEAAVASHGLVPTGGSDAHGEDLGAAGLDRAAFETVREHVEP